MGYQAAPTEDTASWTQLFTALTARGLAPEQVQLVMSDGGTGLPPPIAGCFPNAQQQRCVVHKVRGLERTFVYKELERSGPEGSQLTAEEARQRRQQVSDEAGWSKNHICTKLRGAKDKKLRLIDAVTREVVNT